MKLAVVGLYVCLCVVSESAWRGEALVQGLFLKEGSKTVGQYLAEKSSIQTCDGSTYSLASNGIQPYFALYDDELYTPIHNRSAVVNKLTGKIEEIYVFKGKYEDGSMALLIHDRNHIPRYVQIKRPRPLNGPLKNNNPSLTNHFIRDGLDGKFLRFTDEDYDYEAMANGPVFTEMLKPNPSFHRELSPNITTHHPLRHLHSYISGDGHSNDCSSFKTIPITIIYDYDFCALHGGNADDTRSTVQGIMAYASSFYEDDMCVRLTLSSIIGDSCDDSNSQFSQYQDKTACNPFLDAFSIDMIGRRSELGIDPKSIVHLWSGVEVKGTLGCAWYPGLCDQTHGYGVDYMSYQHPDVPARAFVFAHELGHNLNAIHDDADSDRKTLMAKTPNDASDGFSAASIDTIMTHILTEGGDCVGEWRPAGPTKPPTMRPTHLPTTQPSSPPTLVPPPTQPTIPANAATPIRSPQVLPPTSYPTSTPTSRPTSTPIHSPPPRPTPRPTPNPTLSPSLNPTTNSPPTATPNTTPDPTSPDQRETPYPSLVPEPPATSTQDSAGTAQCALDMFLVDPLCIVASHSGNDYVCLDKDEVFEGVCNAGISVSVNDCGYEFMETAISSQTGRRLLEVVDPYESGDPSQVPAQFLEWESEKDIGLPLCSESCSEVGSMICFRAWTASGFDRWYKVDFTVSDGSGVSQSFGMFAVVKDENGSAACVDDYLVCDKKSTRT